MQEASVAALFELAHKKSVSDIVVEAGGLKILLQAMKKGNASVKALSAGTLGKLAIDIDLLVQLASQGKIPPLVRFVFPTLPGERNYEMSEGNISPAPLLQPIFKSQKTSRNLDQLHD